MDKAWILLCSRRGGVWHAAAVCKNKTYSEKLKNEFKKIHPEFVFKIEESAIFNGPVSRVIRDFEIINDIKPKDNFRK